MFSAGSVPTLQNALPALEKLHLSWEKAAAKPRYSNFIPALNAGMDKITTYYERSADSDAHIMAMGDVFCFTPLLVADWFSPVLDPSKKRSYFHKHWPSDIISHVEDVVQKRVSHLLSLS